MDSSSCRSCNAMVSWARTAATGKPMPLTEDDENGNVVIDSYGKAHAFRDHDAAVAGAAADFSRFGVVATYWIAHHAVCVAGPRWRGKKRGDADAPEAVPAQGVLL